ncbi:hypothetical protein Talka_02283 [Tepidimonas alkaliphilus]|uniref:Uncharacterized protein n=1 Tax=Tepidimonas alkaliphilus TaxID=2588942 RepID=A0A554W3X9_9BURK|nr:hypothetical protein [Tepidimonas alkaliphilus]TSE18256.1 hypothetical protein Talka_02283 [Tepidimonas alkaliphilus]
MAAIPANTKAFYTRFGLALSTVTGQEPRQACKDLGISEAALKSAFSIKGKNLQAKWDDERMERFNAGSPDPADAALLTSVLLWSSSLAASLKAGGIARAAFEEACLQAAQNDPQAASGDLAACWNVMVQAAQALKAKAAASGQHVQSVREAASAAACHFHSKLIHSSAESGALLRVGSTTKALPYLYSGHFEHLELDFFPNGTPTAATCRKANALLQQLRAGQTLAQEDREVAQAFEAAVQEMGSGEDRACNRFVDSRLRQLKIPKDGGYVVITPLACPGLSREIARWQEQIRQEKEEPGETAFRPTTLELGYGGANIQNATSIREVTRVLIFEAPNVAENATTAALSVIHRGWRVPIRDMAEALEAHIKHVRKNAWLDDHDSHLAKTIERADGGALQSAVQIAVADWREKLQALMEAAEDSPDLAEQARQAANSHGVLVKAMLDGGLGPEAVEALQHSIVQAIETYYDAKAHKEPETYLLSDKERTRLRDLVKELVGAKI